MLSLINRFNHGFVAIPVVVACKNAGLFSRLEKTPLTFPQLLKSLSANSGHLKVALKLLESMGWVSVNDKAQYQLTSRCLPQSEVYDNIVSLIDLNAEKYLFSSESDGSLSNYIDKSVGGWVVSDEILADFFDGLLYIPILLAIDKYQLYNTEHHRLNLEQLNLQAVADIERIFVFRNWGEKSQCQLYLNLNNVGQFIVERAMNFGTVASYAPMLTSLPELIFGDVKSVFLSDSEGHEGHVERELNVISSGFQHERYFKQVEELLLTLFNEQPVALQPKYVADVGCGDGTLLKRIFETVKYRTKRGKCLDEYPLTLIGIDFNEKALDITAQNLQGMQEQGLNYFVLKGDIGDPQKIEEDLLSKINDVSGVLYVRSFLDHDRPFHYPVELECIKQRENISYDCVSVDSDGALIPPAVAVQSLAEHMAKWSQIQSRFGIIILEVHSLSSSLTKEYVNESENLHFDAYHGFSRQYLCDAATFLISAAESGLIPDQLFSKKYPIIFPFARISIHYFRKKNYAIRCAYPDDVDALVALEENSLASSLCATKAQILQRIMRFPQGQCVVMIDGEIIASIYSRKTSIAVGALEKADYATWKHRWQHDQQGTCFELLYLIGSDQLDPPLAQEILSFMSWYALLGGGVDKVIGVETCYTLLQEQNVLSTSFEQDLQQGHLIDHSFQNYIKTYDIVPKDDTLSAELALELFGARWILYDFQKAGVLCKGKLHYPCIDKLAEQLQILPKYIQLFHCLLEMFARHQLLQLNGSSITTLPEIEHFALASPEGSFDVFRASYVQEYPHYESFIDLVSCCLKSYYLVLIGEKEATEAVFPGADLDLFGGIFRGNKVADYFNDLVAEKVYRKIESLQQNAPNKLVRVLEVGAGTGGTTHVVLNKVSSFENPPEFSFTDISTTFLRYGKNKFENDFPNVRFDRLNVETSPVEQGFTENSFDVVFATNVLHDTRYIDVTLKNIVRLLKPQGLLIVNEFTFPKDILLFIGGLLHGLWLFKDPEKRIRNSCLLRVDQWQAAMQSQGFCALEAYGLPFEQNLNQSRQSVICGELQPDNLSTENQSTENRVESTTGHLSLIRAQVDELIQTIIGSERMMQLGENTPLMEAGLDSLELLELREVLGKKFQTKLSPIFLFEYNTIAKFVENLHTLTTPEPIPEIVLASNHGTQNIKEHTDDKQSVVLQALREILLTIIGARRLKLVEDDSPLMAIGVDSLELLELRGSLSQRFNYKFSTAFLFDSNTLNKISTFILTQRQSINPVHKSITVPKTAVSKPKYRDKDIAIIGVSLRLAGDIESMDSFWHLLKERQCVVNDLPESRACQFSGSDQKKYDWQGGYLSQIDQFDAEFFRISPKEAILMDPQQRMLLELSWHLFEDAGYAASTFSGSSTGVFIGACHFEYRNLLSRRCSQQEAYFSSGTSASILANRISYYYDLQGPSTQIDTACSSSLFAIDAAINAIRMGRCREALAGGVNLICDSLNTSAYVDAGMLSVDSQCFTFDQRANGFVRGEGGALILMKQAEQALADGDNIYAIIKGSAVNHGGQASSLTAPNPALQARLINDALKDSGVSSSCIGFVETHGTGTALGDPIEVDGLLRVFRHNNIPSSRCVLGAVKTNLGHLEGAAGIVGLLKTVLCLRHGAIPANAHFDNINPQIELGDHLTIAEDYHPWPSPKNENDQDMPRRAGLSSFGFGGSNAHIVLEAAIDTVSCDPAGSSMAQIRADSWLFVLSASNAEQLKVYAGVYESALVDLQNQSAFTFDRLCSTLQIGREALRYKLAIIFSSTDQLIEKLLQYSINEISASTEQVLLENDNATTSDPNQQYQLQELAEQWLAGKRVNWLTLYPEGRPARLAIPQYPFQKTTYWLEDDGPDSLASIPAEIVTTCDLLATDFFLANHQVAGRAVLPGVMYLEMVRAALHQHLQLSTSDITVAFTQVAWLKPISIEQTSLTVGIQLIPENTGLWRFSVSSQRSKDLHAQGAVKFGSQGSVIAQAPLHLPKLQPWAQTLNVREFYYALRQLDIIHGDGFQSLTALYIQGEQTLAKIQLPLSQASTLQTFGLHPSLMDGALQASFAWAFSSGQLAAFVPFSLESFQQFAPLETELWVLVSRSLNSEKAQKFNIHLFNLKGQLIVSMCSYVARLLPMASNDGAIDANPVVPLSTKLPAKQQTLLLCPVWDEVTPQTLAAKPDAVGDTTLIVGGNHAQYTLFSQHYRSAKRFVIASTATVMDIRQSLQAHKQLTRIIWIAPDDVADDITSNCLIQGQESGVITGFRLIKALLAQGYDEKSLQWLVITQQSVALHKGESIDPTQASIHGLIGVMAKEYHNWHVRLVDVARDEPWPLHTMTNLSPDVEGKTWVYRQKCWFKQQLLPVDALPKQHSHYRQGGVYVVIGGAGGIGSEWSRFMIENYQAKLIWIGRRAENKEIRAQLNSLTFSGPKPLYIQADACEHSSMLNAYQVIKRHFSQIHGVVHSALVLQDKSFANMEEPIFRASLAAKVDVSVRLAQVFAQEPLDFVMFFSSITAIARNAGQSNYASGCSFKDAFAQQLAQSWPCLVKVMNWGYWGSVGIVATDDCRAFMRKQGLGSLEPNEAMEGLNQLLGSGINQLAMLKTISEVSTA